MVSLMECLKVFLMNRANAVAVTMSTKDFSQHGHPGSKISKLQEHRAVFLSADAPPSKRNHNGSRNSRSGCNPPGIA